MPETYSAQLAMLASEMKLTPRSSSTLAVIARHRRAKDATLERLVGRLEGPALQVAELLVTDPDGAGDASSREAQMAQLLRAWGDASTRH